MVKQCFERLKCNVNVMREIALRRPNAHLAFLHHLPYHNLYNNKGQHEVLATHYGEWIYVENRNGWEKLVFSLRHNNSLFYHPTKPQFLFAPEYMQKYCKLRAYKTFTVKYCDMCTTHHLVEKKRLYTFNTVIDNLRMPTELFDAKNRRMKMSNEKNILCFETYVNMFLDLSKNAPRKVESSLVK